MKHRIGLVSIFLLLVCTLAFGADRNKKPQRVLSDKQLDSITAGTTGSDSDSLSGSIVAGNSTATQNKSGDVSLSDGAEAESKALNLVNAADSAVANGVNVWDGQMAEQTAATTLSVGQQNYVIQNGSRAPAVLGTYARDANDTLTKVEHKTWDTASSDSHNTATTHLDTTSSSDAITSSGSVDTKSEILGNTLQGGKGIAGTGKLNVNLDGGSVDIKLTGDVASVLTGEIDLNITLPKIGVSFDGSLCVVNGGSCKAGGTEKRSDSTQLEDSASETKSASAHDHEQINSDIHDVTEGAVSVSGASASAIVLDNSSFTSSDSYSVSLSGTSQQNARAVNLVNAGGSLVGNGVNVSRTPTVGPSLDLEQNNQVLQDASKGMNDSGQIEEGTKLEPLGGAIVAGGSNARSTRSGKISLAGNAESNAKSINLVNAADSSVANGVNIWEGQLAGQSTATELTVGQKNVVVQNGQRTAYLPSYARDANSDIHTKLVADTTTSSSSSYSHKVDHLNTTATTRDLTTSGNVDTQSSIAGQTFQGGSGFAGSGDVDFTLDAGTVHFGASANLAGVLKGGLSVDVTLPKLAASFHGSICAVMMGSCAAQGSVTDTSTTTKKDSESEDSTSTSADSGTSDLTVNSSIFGPMKIENAKAESIVVDGSTLSSTKTYSVALAGTSQQNANALNLVNAAGSLIANGINVSRTPTVGPSLNLTQMNVVYQSR